MMLFLNYTFEFEYFIGHVPYQTNTADDSDPVRRAAADVRGHPLKPQKSDFVKGMVSTSHCQRSSSCFLIGLRMVT